MAAYGIKANTIKLGCPWQNGVIEYFDLASGEFAVWGGSITSTMSRVHVRAAEGCNLLCPRGGRIL